MHDGKGEFLALKIPSVLAPVMSNGSAFQSFGAAKRTVTLFVLFVSVCYHLGRGPLTNYHIISLKTGAA